LRGVPLGVSSSEIRARLKAGLPVTHLTPPAVAERWPTIGFIFEYLR
jgi:nicotinic acid mononucleotide adenylyltransferase